MNSADRVIIRLLNQHLDFCFTYITQITCQGLIYIIKQICQLHISLWNISLVPPETATDVNHTFPIILGPLDQEKMGGLEEL